ncbi:MAG: hypothetical protein IT285_11135 [Bdellovibrionales bacterium]|nr:hypothetical protein [Bdellovibrionales bacterium]
MKHSKKTPRTPSLGIGAALGLMIAALFLPASPVQAREVAPANRVLVVITDLDTHGYAELAPLYAGLENIAIGLSNSPLLRAQYREIRVLRDEQATLANFKSLLLNLSARREVDAIDTFLMFHGLPEEIAFYEGTYSVGEIQQAMTEAPTVVDRLRLKILRKKLRLMYNTSCFGSSHRAMFREVGYDTVIGSVGVNANSEFEFPSFLALWTSGATVANALAPSNTPYMLGLADDAIRTAGEFGQNILAETNSRKRISGDRDLTITLSAR